jgi:hypothetical protein
MVISHRMPGIEPRAFDVPVTQVRLPQFVAVGALKSDPHPFLGGFGTRARAQEPVPIQHPVDCDRRDPERRIFAPHRGMDLARAILRMATGDV